MYYRNDPSEYSLSVHLCVDGLCTTVCGVALVGLLLECCQHPPHFLYGYPVQYTKLQAAAIHLCVLCIQVSSSAAKNHKGC